METRQDGQLQTRRTRINKRPWEDDTRETGPRHHWQKHTLPPIDVTKKLKPSELAGGQNTLVNSPSSSENVTGARSARVEDKAGLSTFKDSGCHAHGEPRVLYSRNDTADSGQGTSQEPISSVDPERPTHILMLCPSCQKEVCVPWEEPSNRSNDCERCDNSPELASITEAAAAGLSSLVNTLRWVVAPGKLGSVTSAYSDPFMDCCRESPPVYATHGLRYSLTWLVERIHKITGLAERFVLEDDPSTRSKLGLEGSSEASDHLGPMDHVRSRLSNASNEVQNDVEISLIAREKQLKPLSLGLDDNCECPGIQDGYLVTEHYFSEASDQSSLSMNPPPPPLRQLPSPPSRSFSSPTSTSFLSPSKLSIHGTGQHGANSASPSFIPLLGPRLPPISHGKMSSPALEAHAAALQHEVSVQKIALSSLQGEHDKLLAAFSRSQLRASTLEKKHAVSDNEIVTLTEEKLRLQSQVNDLERDVEDVTRSRDDYRQSGVQENAQYVEIVKRANLLEVKTAAEKKDWKELRTTLEHQIATFSNVRFTKVEDSSVGENEYTCGVGTGESTEPFKIAENTSAPMDCARNEIEHLRKRSYRAESALRAVQAQSLSMEKIVEALDRTKKDILNSIQGVGIDSIHTQETKS